MRRHVDSPGRVDSRGAPPLFPTGPTKGMPVAGIFCAGVSMAHEGSNGKPDAEGGATSRGGQGAGRRVPARRMVKPDAGDDETSRGGQGAGRRVPARRMVKPDAEGSETSGSHRTSSRPATKKDPSEDSGTAETKQPKKEDRGRGGRRTRNRFEE